MKRTVRIGIFVVAALNLAVWLWFKINSGPMPDAAGGDTFWPFVGLILGILTVPALILALADRLLPVAAILVLLPPSLVAITALRTAIG